jgi:hypothetical protein
MFRCLVASLLLALTFGLSACNSASSFQTAVVSIAVTPGIITVVPGTAVQFHAMVAGTSNTAVTWSLSSGTSDPGSISAAGLYTAPLSVSQSLQASVVATSMADPSRSAAANITVTPAVVAISIAPQTVSLTGGETLQFTAAVTGTENTGVRWSASLGTVSGGLFLAPLANTIESATVTATSLADPNQKVSATVAVIPQSNSGPGVPVSFFGLHVNQLNSPWPTVPFASYRSQDSGYIKWADINTSDQTYDWTTFDDWMARAESNGQDIMYTLFITPTWASSRGVKTKSPDYGCVYANISGPGGCDPPDDLNADGSGTDQHWKDFITAMMQHLGPGRIKYWEVWNEFNNPVEWSGSQAQMLRMAKDAYNIVKLMDNNALLTSPSVSTPIFAVDSYLLPYLQSGGGTYADIIAVHGYINLNDVCPSSCPDPQMIAAVLDKSRAAMAASGQTYKPLFDIEGSWGQGTNMTDPDMQVAFTARYFLVQAAGTTKSRGFDKFYWYGWDFRDTGSFYDPQTGTLTASGAAYRQLHNWLVGATVSGCSAEATQWTCSMTRRGYQSEAIWDSSQTCLNGNCSTVAISVAPVYTQYRDLSGHVMAIANGTVPIGLKPILLESGSAPAP